MNYAQAEKLFATARSAEAGKPIANNTRIVKRGDSYAIRLHDTDILTFEPDGRVFYRSGGWRTVTTKARMNEYGPASIFSDRGAWYISTAKASSVPYADGLCVTADGQIIGAGTIDDVSEEKALRKNIGKYAARYVKALYAGEIGTPDNGDCWGCLMVSDDGKHPMGGRSHILSHIKEDYFVPSLIWNAMNYRSSVVMKHNVAVLQKHPGAGGSKLFDADFVRKDLLKAVRKHCLRECGLAA